MTDDLQNLARHVSQRRDELDMTQLEVSEAGGPSNSTLTAIEAARPPVPQRSTLRKLDKALRWNEGSAKRALAGGDPTPLEPGSMSLGETAPPVGAGVDPEVLADLNDLQPDQVQRVKDFIRGIKSSQ